MTVLSVEETYTPYGEMSKLFTSPSEEIVLSGPAGTGKSRCVLEYFNYLATEYPGCRLLMVRKTRRSLTESGMVTFDRKVLHPAQGVRFKSSVQEYQYPNGSILAVGGLDKPEKIMSSEWDAIYPQESTELDEKDWEMCSMRLRWGKTPVQQMAGDCNPSAEQHWLRLRANAGRTLMYETKHEDNPLLFTRNGTMTAEGERYLGKLDRLTGVRYMRYRLGLWSSAEGMVYQDAWDRSLNLINHASIPKDYPRYLVIDFGYINPFCCLWAAKDPDGRLLIYRQIYKTRTLVEEHARTIAIASGWFHLLPKSHPRYRDRAADWADPLPRDIICDHDAQGRATLESHLGLHTTAAKKDISEGIQCVDARLRPAGDGIPRLRIMRDSLVERDQELSEAKQPTCVEDETEVYVWDTRQGKKKGEEPIDANNHGWDCVRYLCAYFDLRRSTVSYYPNLWK